MYFKQVLPWLILFSVFNLSILSIGFLDTDIPNFSVIYIVIINTVILGVFILWDFSKGRSYWRELMKMEKIEEVDSLPVPETPYQKRINERLSVMKRTHNKMLENESKKTAENLDGLTRWIHDMKMPMTTMKLLIDDLDTSKKIRLEEEWVRLDTTLNEMLFERRLVNISNDLYIETVDIETTLSNTIRKLRTLCIEKGIGFDFELNITHVETDLKWFSFMLDQMIGNSVKYSRDSDIMISSYLNEGWPKIEITDYGRGIKSEDLPRVFEANFTSTSDHGDMRATGMGMYLTKEAANAMDISIDIKSVYGEGTTITLTFPKKNQFHRVKTM
ncbi:two-component system, OmpR family, bacitracin resistance sensor histidine kinase BceS [Pelagirhabdus alkalitolerans]|uniref:histidine kinase n=1 Tax=Pelagirhabdus alkalitolerans TaxID=1612202 RepID=A0A1G6K008_9BACI|nr:sensor histidine kinase [Pelagirhabdus alkalitolerans]SDC23626.1 two-component system, OmpR family, bacitracin resistance sensor histidine kinase BceS [Pelagirhabdus alkalitolerans]